MCGQSCNGRRPSPTKNSRANDNMPIVRLPASINRDSSQKLFKSLCKHVHPSWRAGGEKKRVRSGEAFLELLFPDAAGEFRLARTLALEYARMVFKRQILRLQMVMKCRNGWVLLHLLCRLGFSAELEAAINMVFSDKEKGGDVRLIDPAVFIARYNKLIDSSCGEESSGLEILVQACDSVS